LNTANDVLGRMSEFVTANTTAMSTLGARVMVLGKCLDAALPHLTELQRADVTQSFRQGIEDGMVQMDDMALAAAYHSTLLELTNTILTALRQGSATRDQPHILAPGAGVKVRTVARDLVLQAKLDALVRAHCMDSPESKKGAEAHFRNVLTRSGAIAPS
jgi:hypothetical protein